MIGGASGYEYYCMYFVFIESNKLSPMQLEKGHSALVCRGVHRSHPLKSIAAQPDQSLSLWLIPGSPSGNEHARRAPPINGKPIRSSTCTTPHPAMTF
jgi:hypothetical protein